MQILCRREAWYQARILYMEGYNGLKVGENSGWKALEDLEEEYIDYPSLPATSFLPKYIMYHGGNQTYKEDLVMQGLLGRSWFSTVTPSARAEGTKRLLQAIFVPMHTLELFYKARSTCTGGDTKNEAIEYWDRGASLLVGSIEGKEPNGNINGTSWYSMSKEFCRFFGTCNEALSNANAKANEEMMTLLVQGLEGLVDSCEIPLTTMESIESTLLIPLVQGTLHFAVVNSDSIQSQESLGAGYVLAQSILPLVKAGNAASEKYISEWTGSPQQDKYEKVFEALATSWNAFNVNCTKIGSHINTNIGSFCDVIEKLDITSPTMAPTPGSAPPPTGGPSQTDPSFLAGRNGWISLTDVSKEYVTFSYLDMFARYQFY